VTTTAPVAPTTTAAVPTTAGAVACTTSRLALSLGSPSGTAGATHYELLFRNSSSSSCTLYGYPGVSFLTSAGQQIGAPATREPGTTIHTVPLAPGGRAQADLAVTDPGIPPCSAQAVAKYVRVYPPGNTQSENVTAPGTLEVCSSPNTPSYSSAQIGPVTSAG
jgi:hypothetical protein